MIVQHKLDGACTTSYHKYLGCKPTVLVTNRNGGYCYSAEHPETRYQGVFFREHGGASRMFKVIESIRLVNSSLYKEVSEIQNRFTHVTRKRKGTVKDLLETFFMPPGRNALIYTLDREEEVEVVAQDKEAVMDLDIKMKEQLAREAQDKIK